MFTKKTQSMKLKTTNLSKQLIFHQNSKTQHTFTCSKSTIEALIKRWCGICPKLTMKTTEWGQWHRSVVFFVFHAFFTVSIFDFEQVNVGLEVAKNDYLPKSKTNVRSNINFEQDNSKVSAAALICLEKLWVKFYWKQLCLSMAKL